MEEERTIKLERLLTLLWEWYDSPSFWRLDKVKRLMVELRRSQC
jgi:hypothetical protein